MNVAAIPFNRFLGLRADGVSLTLPADPNYQNHLGTVHAGAQFALAEAASGQWLLNRLAPRRPPIQPWFATPTSSSGDRRPGN